MGSFTLIFVLSSNFWLVYNNALLLCCKCYDVLQWHYYLSTLHIKLLQNNDTNNQSKDNTNDGDTKNDNYKNNVRFTMLVQSLFKDMSMINNIIII